MSTGAIDHRKPTTRVFLAIPIPEDTGRQLLATRTKLPFPVRWLNSNSLHLTLLFLGEVSASQLAKLVTALNDFPWPSAFPIQCLHNAPFPKTRSRLFASWVLPSQPLLSLQSRLSNCLSDAGLKFDRKRFKPHITLARAKGTIAQQTEILAEFPVREVVLYESELHRDGSRYHRLATFTLE